MNAMNARSVIGKKKHPKVLGWFKNDCIVHPPISGMMIACCPLG